MKYILFTALILLSSNANAIDLKNDCHKVREGFTICETEFEICEIIDEERIFCKNK
jgi:hypothetical protein